MTTETPEWFEEAVAMKAQGRSVRAISDALAREGHSNTSPANVWLWVTAKGGAQRQKMQTESYRAKARAIAKKHYQQYRSDK